MTDGTQNGFAVGMIIIGIIATIFFLTTPKLKYTEMPDGTFREGPGGGLAVVLFWLVAILTILSVLQG